MSASYLRELRTVHADRSSASLRNQASRTKHQKTGHRMDTCLRRYGGNGSNPMTVAISPAALARTCGLLLLFSLTACTGSPAATALQPDFELPTPAGVASVSVQATAARNDRGKLGATGHGGHGAGDAWQRHRWSRRATIPFAAHHLAQQPVRFEGHLASGRECVRWREPIRMRRGNDHRQHADDSYQVRYRGDVQAASGRYCRRGERAEPAKRKRPLERNKLDTFVTELGHKSLVIHRAWT